MGQRGRSLADRFRQALEQEEDVAKKEEEDRLARIAAAQEARNELFGDLAEFGKAVGFIAVSRNADGVTFRLKERFVHFRPQGDGDGVKVEVQGFEGEDHRLYREAHLGDRWIWSRVRRNNNEDRLPLFDQGLEELMVRYLGMPRPGGDEPDEEQTPRVRTTTRMMMGTSVRTSPAPAAPKSSGDDDDEVVLPGRKRNL